MQVVMVHGASGDRSVMLLFEGAGHHVQPERAGQVNAAIAEFAAGLEAAG